MILDIKKAHVYHVSNVLIAFILMGILLQTTFLVIFPFDGQATSLFNAFAERPLIGLFHSDLLELIISLFNVFILLSLSLFLYHFKPLLSFIALTFGLLGITLYMAQHDIVELHTLFTLYQKDSNITYLNHAQFTLDLHYNTAWMMSKIVLGISWLLYGIIFFIAKNVSSMLRVITILLGLMAIMGVFFENNIIYSVCLSIIALGFYSLLWVSFHRNIKTIKKEVSTD